MVRFSTSVSVANVILWILIEVFLILFSNAATRLVARFSVNYRLLSNCKIRLNHRNDLIDKIPYNGDLFLAKPPLKFMLTLYRICIIGISVCIGASLDGERELSSKPFPASSETFLSSTAGELTANSGEDLNAMAKLSCLRVVNNNFVILYKGYVSTAQNILCEDGNSTESENNLLKAEIRAAFRTRKTGRNISDMAMHNSTYEGQPPSIERNHNKLVVHVKNGEEMPTNISARVVLMDRLNEGKCRFGIWRSKELGFSARVDVKLEAPCTIRIAALDRLLRRKPEFLPPRMSILFQIVDSVLLSKAAVEAPRVREENIVAALPVEAIILLAVAIAFSAVIVIVFGSIIRRGKVKTNLFSARGIADVLGGPSGKQVLFRCAKDSDRVVCDHYGVVKNVDETESIQGRLKLDEAIEKTVRRDPDAEA